MLEKLCLEVDSSAAGHYDKLADKEKTGGKTGAIHRARDAQPRSGIMLLDTDWHCDLVPTGREASKRCVATACRPW